jgi:hypothetical protein
MALCMQVGWKLFDKDGKGHIDASDLRRVCLEMGYKVCRTPPSPPSPPLPLTPPFPLTPRAIPGVRPGH